MIRSTIRDVMLVYLGYETLRLWWSQQAPHGGIALIAVILVALTAWFALEKLGVLPKAM